MNPVNTDKNKINRISFMVIDGFNIKKGTIKDVTKNCLNLLEKEKKCFVLIICSEQNNLVDREKEIKSILNSRDSFNIIDSFDVEKKGIQKENGDVGK